jgi:hypothetical protein
LDGFVHTVFADLKWDRLQNKKDQRMLIFFDRTCKPSDARIKRASSKFSLPMEYLRYSFSPTR